MAIGEIITILKDEADNLDQQAREVLATINRLTDPNRDSDPLLTSEVVAGLGVAAMHLIAASRRLESAPFSVAPDSVETGPTPLFLGEPAEEDGSDSPSLENDQAEQPLGESDAAVDPTPEDPEPADTKSEPVAPIEPPAGRTTTAVKPRVKNLGRTEHRRIRLESIKKASDLSIKIDPDKNEKANAAAIYKHGGEVRRVVIIDDRTIDIEGHRVSVWDAHTKTPESRIRLVNLLLDRRGEYLTPQDITRVYSTASASNTMRIFGTILCDSSGKSIITTVEVNPKRFDHALASDVVIIDARQKPEEDLTGVTGSEQPAVLASQAESVEATLTAASGESDPKETDETPAITLNRDSLVIDGKVFLLTAWEHALISQIYHASQALGPLEVTQSYQDKEQVPQSLVDQVADDLFVLYKMGLLTESWDDNVPFYQLNAQAAEAIASKVGLEIHGNTVLLDEEDLAIIDILDRAGPLSLATLTRSLTKREGPADRGLARITRTLKMYLSRYDIIERPKLYDKTYTLTKEARAAYAKYKGLPVEPTTAPAETPEPSTRHVKPIPVQELSLANLRGHILSISNLEALNKERLRQIKAKGLTAVPMIFKPRNMVTVNGIDKMVRSDEIELLNHLLLNIGRPVTAESLWHAGYNLNTTPLAQERPSPSKLKEAEGLMYRTAKKLNDTYGVFITLSDSGNGIGIGSEFVIEDRR
ncbi:MAG TPA: hypothetical protein VMR18_00270 [Candidatus Saccharimonadales bacterium]|nr:hypothetical protein [Candidatus Saccharimonadales bacterium]